MKFCTTDRRPLLSAAPFLCCCFMPPADRPAHAQRAASPRPMKLYPQRQAPAESRAAALTCNGCRCRALSYSKQRKRRTLSHVLPMRIPAPDAHPIDERASPRPSEEQTPTPSTGCYTGAKPRPLDAGITRYTTPAEAVRGQTPTGCRRCFFIALKNSG